MLLRIYLKISESFIQIFIIDRGSKLLLKAKKIKEAEKASVLNKKKQTCLDYYQKLEV